jgi:hypothetical protein
MITPLLMGIRWKEASVTVHYSQDTQAQKNRKINYKDNKVVSIESQSRPRPKKASYQFYIQPLTLISFF